MIQPCRVLVVDDHKHAREAMRILLDQDPLFQCVGEGCSGEEALRLADERQPEMILMDINMKGMDGLEATKAIKIRHPSVKIVIVTISDDVVHLFDSLKKGASGYLIKNLNPSSWLDYLKAVALDEVPLSREIAQRMLQEFVQQQERSSSSYAPVTAREKEILSWIAKGASNREIAERLFISEHTVKNHLKNILHKLHLDNRVQLARYAIENRIL